MSSCLLQARDQVTHCHVFGSWFIFLACMPHLHLTQPAVFSRQHPATVANAGTVGDLPHNFITDENSAIAQLRADAGDHFFGGAVLLHRFFLLGLAQCGLGLFRLVFRSRSGVIVRAPLRLDAQLLAPAAGLLLPASGSYLSRR